MSSHTDRTYRTERRPGYAQEEAAERGRPPVPVYVLLAAVLFQGVSGVAGGIGLLMDPTGASLSIPIDWLAGSPFPDYSVPGLVLLVALGIFPLVVFYGLLTGKNWGLVGAWLVGLALLMWLFVEIVVIGYQAQPPLQLIYGAVGVVILVLGMLPSVRSFYSAERTTD